MGFGIKGHVETTLDKPGPEVDCKNPNKQSPQPPFFTAPKFMASKELTACFFTSAITDICRWISKMQGNERWV